MSKLGELLLPEDAVEPILAKPVRAALLEWLTEVFASDRLKAVGLEPRRRALFTGPPGTGKTTLAHHLAARLGLPMAVIRPDQIVGQYIGTGVTNVSKIFDEADAEDEPLVLFFDEFESVAQTRMDSGGKNSVGEHDHNSMVNTLLTRMDRFKGFVIAATNAAGTIDPAVWRRFDIHIEIKTPGGDERVHILSRYLAPYGMPKAALSALSDATETASPALIRAFCEGLKRQMVLGAELGWDMRREAVIDRLLVALEPHPDLGRPRLWSHGSNDAAVKTLPWPLPLAVDVVEDAPPAPASNVTSLNHFMSGGGRRP